MSESEVTTNRREEQISEDAMSYSSDEYSDQREI
jgi:hypothetical protein